MFHPVFFCLCLWRLVGVFGDGAVTSVSVKEGDSVTLNSDLTEIQTDDLITWTFGHSETLIAQISKQAKLFSTSHGNILGFRDKLKLNNQTGSLTITNITTEHDGVYELLVVRAKPLSKAFRVSVNAHLPVSVISTVWPSSSSSPPPPLSSSSLPSSLPPSSSSLFIHCCCPTEAVIRLVLSALVGVATVILLVYDIRSRRAEGDQAHIHTSEMTEM